MQRFHFFNGIFLGRWYPEGFHAKSMELKRFAPKLRFTANKWWPWHRAKSVKTKLFQVKELRFLTYPISRPDIPVLFKMCNTSLFG